MQVHSFWKATAIACAMLLPAVSGHIAQAQDVVFAIAEPDMVVEPGAAPGRTTLLLDATGIDDSTAQTPLTDLADAGTPAPPQLGIAFTAAELAPTAGARHWILTAEVKGLTTELAAQKRVLTLRFGSRSYAVTYNLTGHAASPFGWSVKAPTGEISLRPGQSVEIGISVQGIAATGVRLMQAALIEGTTHTMLQKGWQLCETPSGDCPGEDLTIPANSVKRLWLRPAANETVVGKFTGTVVIGASQKLDGETLTLSISGTSPWLQFWGVMVIFAGLALAIYVNKGLQNRINRAQMLLPVARLRERAEGFAARLATAPASLAGAASLTSEALRNLLDDLSEQALDSEGWLPSKIPDPYKPAPKVIEDGYKTYLDNRTQKLAWLHILISQGFEALWRKLPANPTDEDLKAAQTASAALDALSDKAAPPDSAPAQDIESILTKFESRANPDLLELVAKPPEYKAPSFQDLTVAIGRMSYMVWGIFALIAGGLGTYVLILSNAGFGLPMDFLTCLFWGFGMPVGAQQLSQSTMANASQALQIQGPGSN